MINSLLKFKNGNRLLPEFIAKHWKGELVETRCTAIKRGNRTIAIKYLSKPERLRLNEKGFTTYILKLVK